MPESGQSPRRKINADVVIIRGAPGLGKSTLAEMLRRSFPAGSVIDVDDVRRIICGEQFVYNENLHYLNAISVSGALARTACAFGHRPVIAVDVFSSEMLKAFIDAIPELSTYTVSLHAPDAILTSRMESRHDGYVNTPVACKVNSHIYQTRKLGDLLMDVGDMSPDEACDAILGNLNDHLL